MTLNTHRGYKGTYTLQETERGISVYCDDPCAYHYGYRGMFDTVDAAVAYIERDIISDVACLKMVKLWLDTKDYAGLRTCCIRPEELQRLGFDAPADYRYR